MSSLINLCNEVSNNDPCAITRLNYSLQLQGYSQITNPLATFLLLYRVKACLREPKHLEAEELDLCLALPFSE